MITRLLLVLTLSATFARPRPSPGRPQDKMEINVETLENTQDGSLGGELDTLITDIFNRIIKYLLIFMVLVQIQEHGLSLKTKDIK